MPIKKSLSSDRFEFTDNLTKNTQIKFLQTSRPCKNKTYKSLNDYFFSERKDVQLRVYGFYSSECDLKFLKDMNNVESFSADFNSLSEAPTLEEFILCDGKKQQPSSLDPIFINKSVKAIGAWFGSEKKMMILKGRY